MHSRIVPLLLALVALAGPLPAAETNFLTGARRVVFLGDSITHSGQYIEDAEAYLASRFPDQPLRFINLGLPSETVSGLSEPGHAGGSFPRPDLHERLGRVLAQARPDVIVACYGMNDGIYHPFSEERFHKFQDGIRRLRLAAAAAGAKVVHLTPPTFDAEPIKGSTLPAGRDEYRRPYVGYNEVLDRYSEWLLSQRAEGWEVIDAHGPMNRHLAERRRAEPAYRLAGDGVHIDGRGHWLIARELLVHLGAPKQLLDLDSAEALLSTHPRGAELLGLVQQRQRLLRDSWLGTVGHKRPGMGKGLPLADAEKQAAALETRIRAMASPYPGPRSSWHGFDCYDFPIGGKSVRVVLPYGSAKGKPWVWHGEFFGHKPEPDIALLKRGFHLVAMSAPNLLGSPQAVALWNTCYAELTSRYGFNAKVALVGLSRGGLYCYNWAAANPEKVACLYGDAPVCDFKSWPGGKGKGKGSPGDWKLVMDLWHFKSEAEALAYDKNPVDNLAPLAAARVPLLHVYGDADDVVPWDENTGVVARRYKELGGSITLINKPGVGHHPHGLADPAPIVEFILRNTPPSP